MPASDISELAASTFRHQKTVFFALRKAARRLEKVCGSGRPDAGFHTLASRPFTGNSSALLQKPAWRVA
jgi:hypothetical protein